MINYTVDKAALTYLEQAAQSAQEHYNQTQDRIDAMVYLRLAEMCNEWRARLRQQSLPPTSYQQSLNNHD